MASDPIQFVFLCRHAESDRNVAKRVLASKSALPAERASARDVLNSSNRDSGLSDCGKASLLKLRRAFARRANDMRADLKQPPVLHVLVSPFQRCLLTAEACAQGWQDAGGLVRITVDDHLIETSRTAHVAVKSAMRAGAADALLVCSHSKTLRWLLLRQCLKITTAPVKNAAICTLQPCPKNGGTFLRLRDCKVISIDDTVC